MTVNEAAEQLRYNLAGEIDADSNLTLLDVALAHERSAGTAPLDVDLLTEALANTYLPNDRYTVEPFAERIAAEYVRLAKGTDR